jgi:hypothetical protein
MFAATTSCLIFSHRMHLHKAMIRALRCAGFDAQAEVDPLVAKAALDAHAVDVVILDVTTAASITSVLPAAQSRALIIGMSPVDSAWTLTDAICDLGLTHFVPFESGEDADVQSIAANIAVATRRAMQIGADDELPLQAGAYDVLRFSVRHAEDREVLMDCARDYLEWIGARRKVRDDFLYVLDEMVTNAVYNAPRDEAGMPKYASLSRTFKVCLEEEERVAVSFACDGERLALSVTDRFGSLDLERIRARLRDCHRGGQQIERKRGGAGIGLFCSLAAVESLEYQVEAGAMTRATALFSLRQRSSLPHTRFHFVNRGSDNQEQPSVVLSSELQAQVLSHAGGTIAEIAPIIQARGTGGWATVDDGAPPREVTRY